MDAVKKNSYMSITIHYIDEMFNLYARTLHVKHVEETSHTVEMVLEEFSKGLIVFKVTADMYQQIIVVSDSDSNCCGVNGIPSAFYWLACLDHKLATVLTTVVNKTTKMENGVRSKPFYRYKDVQHMLPLFMMIDACKKAGRVLQVRELAEPAQQGVQAGERNSMKLAAPLPSKHQGNVRRARAALVNEGQAKQAQ
jgi:hypothetical protein